MKELTSHKDINKGGTDTVSMETNRKGLKELVDSVVTGAFLLPFLEAAGFLVGFLTFLTLTWQVWEATKVPFFFLKEGTVMDLV